MRVLHVSEALGGGITSSILAMVEATPQIDHHLLARPRSGHETGADVGAAFGSVALLPHDPVRAVLSVRRQARELFPDIVHAHSSIAGAVVRLAGLNGPRVVYSPHCFAFERRDLSRVQRLAYAGIERALAPRTNVLLAVAPNEIDLAVELGHDEVCYAPNRGAEPKETVRHRDPLHVVSVGRLCRQKDWRYLLHVKRYAETQLGLDATWEWLGGGDPEAERCLSAAGVQVSGWIERRDLLRRMSRAQAYLHTAAWEGAPISVLEAAALGLPLALRAIPALDSLRLPGRCDSVAELAHRLETLQDPQRWQAAQRQSLALAATHSRAEQGRRLVDAYERAQDRPARVDMGSRPARVLTLAPDTARVAGRETAVGGTGR